MSVSCTTNTFAGNSVCVCVAINTVPLRCVIKFHVNDAGDNAGGSGVPGNI